VVNLFLKSIVFCPSIFQFSVHLLSGTCTDKWKKGHFLP